MTREEHRKLVVEWLAQPEPQVNDSQLREALYTVGELELWPDYVDSVSAEQCICCWQIIQTLLQADFPADLRM